MISKASKVLEIDTKEICLLCYEPCRTSDGVEILTSQRASPLTGFKQLLRYLKVNIKELFNCSPRILEWMEIQHEIDVKITLCAKCLVVTAEFDKVYKEYELIQFRFDKCLTSLHKSMKSGDENPVRVREFKKQMQPNQSFDLINASIAVNLRDQTFRKCSIKLENLLPRVTVQKINRNEDNNHIKQIPINLNDCHLNRPSSHNTLKAISPPMPIKNHHLINIENDEDVQDWPYTISQPVEVIEVDPLELETDLTNDDDVESDDILPIHFHFPLVTSSASSLTCSSSQLTKKTPRRRSKICDVCNKSFERSHDVYRHKYQTHPEHLVYKHYSKLSLSLVQCKDLTEKFLQHALSKSVKTGIRAIECCFCDKIISCRKNLKAHLFCQHMELVVDVVQNLNPSTSNVKKQAIVEEKCEQCPKVFASKAQLNKHMTAHYKLYSCQYCTYTNPYTGTIKSHELDEHIVDVVTPHLGTSTCPVKFSQRVNTCCKKLLKIGTRCLICKCQTIDKYSLRRHMLQQHFMDVIKELKKMLDQGQVNDHDSEGNENQEKDDHSNEIVSCQFCSFVTTHPDAAKRHQLEIHTVELVMKYLPPNTCRITCAQGVEAYHKNLTTLGTNCPLCISTFYINADLQRHVLNQHFSEFVKELKDYLGHSEEGKDEGSQQKVIVPTPVDVRIMEFETDNVKFEVEVEANSGSDNETLVDPLSVDYLNLD